MKYRIDENGNEKELAGKVYIDGSGQEHEVVAKVYIDGNGQEHEIWSNGVKAINLGMGTSFNIQTLLPNVDYTQLTDDNFVIATSSTTYLSGSGGYGEDETFFGNVATVKNYDNQTGVLTCYTRWNADGRGTINSNVQVYYVKNPLKLKFIGHNTSIDIKNIYKKWQNLTIDNFVVKVIPSASTSFKNDATHLNYAEVSFGKSYSNGVITLYTRAYSTRGYAINTGIPDIYIVDKVV